MRNRSPLWSFFLADHRATDFTYIKIGGIATRFKRHLSMGRLMICCKCVLPCVFISFHKTFFYHPTLLFMQDHSYISIYNNKYLITASSRLHWTPYLHWYSRNEMHNTQIGCRRSPVLLRLSVRLFYFADRTFRIHFWDFFLSIRGYNKHFLQPINTGSFTILHRGIQDIAGIVDHYCLKLHFIVSMPP